MFEEPRAGIQKGLPALHLHLPPQPLPHPFHSSIPGLQGGCVRGLDAGLWMPQHWSSCLVHTWHIATLLPLLELQDKGRGKEATQALAAARGCLWRDIQGLGWGVVRKGAGAPGGHKPVSLWTFKFTPCSREPKGCHLKRGPVPGSWLARA